MSRIKFGTDGWRALMDKDFTFENVEILAQAYADWLNQTYKGKTPRVAIGYDWRKNSEHFAKSFTEVLIANKIDVLLSNAACPTPALSFTIVDRKLDSGIMVTASHNPPNYNGIKIKTDFGGSAEKTITDTVEGLLGKNPVKKAPYASSHPKIEDLNGKYLEFLKAYLRLDVIKNAPFRILVDSMHGVGGRNIEKITAGGKLRVETVRGDRDLSFGGFAPEPIPHNLKPSMEIMKKREHDLCIVTDGDADRVGALRPGGEFISPGIILSLILIHFVEDLKRTGSVVTTVSNTGLIYRVAKKHHLKVHETPVGFKYVCDIMRKERVLIGGEESGGIGFQDYLYERDGMLSGLLLIQMMAMRGKTFEQILADVEREFGKLHYVRQDIDYPNELKARLFEVLKTHPPKTLAGHAVKETKSADGMKFVLEDGSWLLFRLSGTEPILRVYAEGTSPELAQSLAAQGKELAFGLSPA